MKVTVALLSLFFLLSCFPEGDPNEEIDEGKIENNTYHSDDLGWTMDIPEGWSITTMEQTNQSTEAGSELFEEELGIDVDYSNLKNLLAFQKNDMNSFSSNSEPWIDDGVTSWKENNAALKVFLMDVFEGQNIPIDSSSTKVVEIDGINFEAFTFTIYNQDGAKMFKQVMYSSLINGYDFGASMMYSNEKDKNEMMAAWMNSTFDKN